MDKADILQRLQQNQIAIVIHAYFGLDDNIIWDVVKNKIPELLNQVEEIGNINDAGKQQ